MTTYNQQLQELFHEYERDHGFAPTSTTDAASWAIRNKRWQMRPADVVSRLAEHMADALRQEYKVGSKGRKYRVNHAVRDKQGSFWADIDTAPRRHMEKAFAQRRKQIVGDCIQLKVDVDVYNEKNATEEPINLILDFTYDVAEIQALTNDEAA